MASSRRRAGTRGGRRPAHAQRRCRAHGDDLVDEFDVQPLPAHRSDHCLARIAAGAGAGGADARRVACGIAAGRGGVAELDAGRCRRRVAVPASGSHPGSAGRRRDLAWPRRGACARLSAVLRAVPGAGGRGVRAGAPGNHREAVHGAARAGRHPRASGRRLHHDAWRLFRSRGGVLGSQIPRRDVRARRPGRASRVPVVVQTAGVRHGSAGRAGARQRRARVRDDLRRGRDVQRSRQRVRSHRLWLVFLRHHHRGADGAGLALLRPFGR